MSARNWLRPATKPSPRRVLADPATVDACADDYRQGTADRATSAKKDRRASLKASREGRS